MKKKHFFLLFVLAVVAAVAVLPAAADGHDFFDIYYGYGYRPVNYVEREQPVSKLEKTTFDQLIEIIEFMKALKAHSYVSFEVVDGEVKNLYWEMVSTTEEPAKEPDVLEPDFCSLSGCLDEADVEAADPSCSCDGLSFGCGLDPDWPYENDWFIVEE